MAKIPVAYIDTERGEIVWERRLVTPNQYAQEKGITGNAVRRYIQMGRIPAYILWLGHQGIWLVDADDPRAKEYKPTPIVPRPVRVVRMDDHATSPIQDPPF